MNRHQAVWLEQARSDREVLILLRRSGAAACHQLHYWQMVTEKLGKAYFWRSGSAPPKSHASFVQFLRTLGSAHVSQRQRIADVFRFGRFEDFQNWIRSILPLAYALERLAPTLAGAGSNPEYPWPPIAPKFAPVSFEFDVWIELTGTGRGRQLMQVIEIAVDQFAAYG